MQHSRLGILKLLFGNPEEKPLEYQIPLVLSFATALLSLVASALNVFIGLSTVMIIIPLCASVCMFLVYLGLRNTNRRYLFTVLMSIIAFVYFNFLWFHNFESHGPNLYLFIIFFIFIIFIFERKSRIFFASLVLINIFLLYLIELNEMGIGIKYDSEKSRLMDVYFSMFIYLGFTSIMAIVIRYYYRLERTKAKRSDKLKSAFLSNMSHEIRTPMNAILGFSKMLEYAENEEERKEYVSIINDNGKVLLELLDDILDISKMDAGQFDIFTKEIALKPVFNDLYKITRLYLNQLNKPNVELILDLPPNDSIVLTDGNRVRQIMYNFLTNASKFTFSGNITFGYRVVERDVTFFVSDTGLGIEKKFQTEIFKRFFKVENAEYTTLPRGSGIGLSIASLLVHKLGGTISFNSIYKKGSQFSFSLPEIIVSKGKGEIVATISQEQVEFKGKILVAEDDESNMLLICNMLKRLKLEVVKSVNGAEACSFLEAFPDINLILMDINMPVMNGFDAMKQIKQLYPHIPIIALTAHAMNTEKEKALIEGFNGYITKPVEQKVLIDNFRNYLPFATKVKS